MISVGGKPPPRLITATGLESSSSPKLGFVFASAPSGGSVINLRSRGSLRIKAVEGSRRVILNGKVDDSNDKSTNGHAGNSCNFQVLQIFWDQEMVGFFFFGFFSDVGNI